LQIGDVLLAAAFVSYAGPFNMFFRKQLVDDNWLPDLLQRGIPSTQGIRPLDLLTDDTRKAKWANEGLPIDPLSVENGAIMTNSSRWALMIDPQLQVGEEGLRSEGSFCQLQAPNASMCHVCNRTCCVIRQYMSTSGMEACRCSATIALPVEHITQHTVMLCMPHTHDVLCMQRLTLHVVVCPTGYQLDQAA
jgi:hypothetical protein